MALSIDEVKKRLFDKQTSHEREETWHALLSANKDLLEDLSIDDPKIKLRKDLAEIRALIPFARTPDEMQDFIMAAEKLLK